MSQKVKLKVTAVREYWADTDAYGTSDPQQMAAIDADSSDVFDLLNHEDTVITIVPA